MAQRIRRLRLSRGMTLARLAERASRALAVSVRGRNRSVSVSYLSLIENGRKVPDEPVALALARALTDDVRVYRAWVRTRKRADLADALAAAETLRKLLDETPASAAPPPRAARGRSAGEPDAATRGARLRIPVIPPDANPGEGVRPSCEVLEWLRFDMGALDPRRRERLDRPFAFRIDEAMTRRVRGLVHPGCYGVVLRRFLPLTPGAVYAVRHEGDVLLSRVLWNGSSLLLLPSDGDSDFVVVDIGSETLLGRYIVGEISLAPRDSVAVERAIAPGAPAPAGKR